MFKKIKKLTCVAMIILLIISLIGCKKKEEEEKKKSEESIPQELENIMETSENIIKDIEKIQLAVDDPEAFIKESKGEDEKEEESEEGSEGGGSKKEEETKSGGEEGKSSEEEKPKEEESPKEKEKKEKEELDIETKKQIDKLWGEINKKVEEIHSAWNNYEPKAMEDGASANDIEKFEEYLNNITISADEKSMVASYENVNELTNRGARFLDFYKGNIDAEIYRIKYFIRKAYINGKKGDWELVKEDMDNIQPIFSKLSGELESKKKKKSDSLKKLELSIKDMKDAANEENEKLMKIKSDIILENLKNIQNEAKADEE